MWTATLNKTRTRKARRAKGTQIMTSRIPTFPKISTVKRTSSKTQTTSQTSSPHISSMTNKCNNSIRCTSNRILPICRPTCPICISMGTCSRTSSNLKVLCNSSNLTTCTTSSNKTNGIKAAVDISMTKRAETQVSAKEEITFKHNKLLWCHNRLLHGHSFLHLTKTMVATTNQGYSKAIHIPHSNSIIPKWWVWVTSTPTRKQGFRTSKLMGSTVTTTSSQRILTQVHKWDLVLLKEVKMPMLSKWWILRQVFLLEEECTKDRESTMAKEEEITTKFTEEWEETKITNTMEERITRITRCIFKPKTLTCSLQW